MLEEEKIKELEEELREMNKRRNSIINTIEDLKKDININKFKNRYFKIITKSNDIYYISILNTGKFLEIAFCNRENYNFRFNVTERELCNILHNSDGVIQELIKEEYKKDLFEFISKYIDLIKQQIYERIS